MATAKVYKSNICCLGSQMAGQVHHSFARESIECPKGIKYSNSTSTELEIIMYRAKEQVQGQDLTGT